MLYLRNYIAASPVTCHLPCSYFTFPKTDEFFTVGKAGEIVKWFQGKPLLTMMASLTSDTGRLLCAIATPLRLLVDDIQPMLLATLHADTRIRIWDPASGLCIKCSAHNLIPRKLSSKGTPQEPIMVLNELHDTKFIFIVCEGQLHIVDMWSMTVISEIAIPLELAEKILGGNISAKKQLILLSSSHSFTLNVKSLLGQVLLDLGGVITDYQAYNSQVTEIVAALIKSSFIIQRIKKPVIPVTIYAWPEEQTTIHHEINKVKKTIVEMSQTNPAGYLFSRMFQQHYPVLSHILEGQKLTVSNLAFVRDDLWLCVGTNNGNLLVIPAVSKINQLGILTTQCNEGPVQFCHFDHESLLVSWSSGHTKIFDSRRLRAVIQASKQSSQVKVCDISEAQLGSHDLSSSVKRKLPIVPIMSQQAVKEGLNCFQLTDNCLALYDRQNNKLTSIYGMSPQRAVYFIFTVSEYIGILHESGVEMFDRIGYERTMDQSNWSWRQLAQQKQSAISQLKDRIGPVVDGIGLVTANARALLARLPLDRLSPELYEQLLGNGRPSDESMLEHYFLRVPEVEKVVHSQAAGGKAAIVRLKFSDIRRDRWDNCGYAFFSNMDEELTSLPSQKTNLGLLVGGNTLFFTQFNWEDDQVPLLSQFMRCDRPIAVLSRRPVLQGAGNSVTIYELEARTQGAQPIIYEAMATLTFMQGALKRIPQLTESMVEIVQHYTRLSLPDKVDGQLLALLTLSPNQEVVRASLNLLTAGFVAKSIKPRPLVHYFLINLDRLRKIGQTLLSEAETHWICYVGMWLLYGGEKYDSDKVRMFVGRLVECIQLINFEQQPELVLTVLRIFNEGLKVWAKALSSNTISQLLLDMFYIFFSYEGLTTIPSDDKKFVGCFSKQPIGTVRKMKHAIVGSVCAISQEFEADFLQILRSQALSHKHHHMYPASVVELLRQLLKLYRPQKHMVFFVQLLLQCLSPMNPQFRKYVQKSVLATLQLMCSYRCVSFNQPCQKLSLRTYNNLYVYCLRTSTRWRTIQLKEIDEETESYLEMSPQGNFLALLSDRLQIWRLGGGFWGSVLGAFSQGWTFEATGNSLKWDQNEESVTVINRNPSLNRNFKL